MKNQPEALRLADKYETEGFLQDHRFAAQEHWCRQAATELRRQHERITELEAQLSATNPIQQGLDAQANRYAVIQHLTNYGVLEHDGCGIFIASGDASELIDACMALDAKASQAQRAPLSEGQRRAIFDDLWPHGADAGIRKLFTATVFATEAAHGITQENQQ